MNLLTGFIIFLAWIGIVFVFWGVSLLLLYHIYFWNDASVSKKRLFTTKPSEILSMIAKSTKQRNNP